MRLKIAIQALTIDVETNGAEPVPDLGRLLAPAPMESPALPVSLPRAEPAALPLITGNGVHHRNGRKPKARSAPRRTQMKPQPAGAPERKDAPAAYQGRPRWEGYPTRTAQKQALCALCPAVIHPGMPYRDGGAPNLRAHESCVAKRLQAAAVSA